jgi:hypothetical protein
MPYQVYVGYAVSIGDPEDWVCVVLCPHAIYTIDAPDEWWKTEEERRIWVE